VLFGALCSSSLIREASPCTTRLRRSRVSGRKKIAPAASMSSAKCYICYVPRPTCWGSIFLCMPSLAIKGEAYNVTKQAQSLGLDSQLLSFHSNPTHNGVGCYAPAARTTLKSSRVHVLDVRLAGQAKCLSPFLILGFRAGALCHPAGEFPLRQGHFYNVLVIKCPTQLNKFFCAK
jgi:hypothetical protein